MEKTMRANFTQYLEAQRTPMKEAVIELVRIPSITADANGDYPFGEAIDQALRKELEIAEGLGFRTRYGAGGYYGIAEIGEGEELLGVVGHLDVVEPGRLEDWDNGPFDPLEKDGYLYGRGTQDDKGPLAAALFAVKALMDAGVKFNKRVRFIFGTDEETLWRCINRYKACEEMPSMGFSPDSRFPLTYAEKGLLQLNLEGANISGLSFSGGSGYNAVPDSLFYNGSQQDELARKLDELGFSYERTSNGIEAKGKAAHAMVPEEGVNAIARLCIALHEIGLESKAVEFIANEIGEDPYATRIFGECADEPSGKLKFNIGKIRLDAVEQICIDCRLPVTVSKEAVVAKLSHAAARYGLEYKEFDWLGPIYLPKDHFMIETLMRVYREYTGDTLSEPIASGGATYARAIDNCVAFGPIFPGELITEHQPNERAALENLYRAMEIYAYTIFELTR
jgi:succinyl-diaminopimelate desuccinylase